MTKKQLPTVRILATGGTIAGKGSTSMQTTDYQPGELTIDEMLASVPELALVAQVQGEQFCNVASSAINVETWLRLAQRINDIFSKEPTVNGIVITHGTDTLEETAYFLNLVVKSNRPVVLVGAMRPATALSADGPMNLVNAVQVASTPSAKGMGVLVVLNGQIFAARDVTKGHTSNLNAFDGSEFGPLGTVNNGQVSFYHQHNRKHTLQTEFSVEGLSTLPRVDILYSHIGADDAMIKAMISIGTQGIVHAGNGAASGSPATSSALWEAAEAGIIVARGSRVGSGRILPPVKQSLEQGFVSVDNLNPQKARILLMLALSKTKQPKDIQKMFLQY